jgi:ABC-2 type transport system permease protein
MLDQFRTALRYTLQELARNRLAAGLLIIFVPLWYFLLGALINDAPVAFKFGLTGKYLQVDGHNLTLMTLGTNTVTLILGFLFFSSTRGASAFDQRLVRGGYRQVALMLAKVTAMVVASAAVSSYALAILAIAWRPRGLFMLWLSFLLAALIYGALGLLLGALLRSELAGFFIIVMLSLLDTFFQNPVDNPVGNASFLKAFPTYGPTQVGVAGGFTSVFPGREILISLAWFAALALIGLAIFWARTRAWNVRAQRAAMTGAATA